MNVISWETRMMGLPYGEEIMIVGRTMWTQWTSVTDRQTDRQTDRITITKTVQRIASHGKKRRRLFSLTKSKHLLTLCTWLQVVIMDYGNLWKRLKKGLILDRPDLIMKLLKLDGKFKRKHNCAIVRLFNERRTWSNVIDLKLLCWWMVDMLSTEWYSDGAIRSTDLEC